MNKQYYVYIITNKRNGTLYVGVTNNLVRRIREHKEGIIKGFSCKYKLHMLVWYETHESIYSVIKKEKDIKNWKRISKIYIIETMNPNWEDLWNKIF